MGEARVGRLSPALELLSWAWLGLAVSVAPPGFGVRPSALASLMAASPAHDLHLLQTINTESLPSPNVRSFPLVPQVPCSTPPKTHIALVPCTPKGHSVPQMP